MIAVVIPDYNGWAQTRTCLARLSAGIARDAAIIVVDHGTTEETGTGLRAAHPEVIHVRAAPTLWWAGATNVGIREALGRGASSVMLLNNDCYVNEGTVAALLAHAATAGDGTVIAPLQRNASDSRLRRNAVGSCYLLGFPTVPRPWPRGAREGEHRLLPVGLIIGGRGVLIGRGVFERVGLLDEETFPHYGADHDFYHRCVRAGVPLYLALDASVEIDDTRTSTAAKAGRLSFGEMAASLADRRSHRNVKDLSALFRRYYPIPGLHYVGVALNVARYVAVHVASRAAATLMGRGRSGSPP